MAPGGGAESFLQLCFEVGRPHPSAASLATAVRGWGHVQGGAHLESPSEGVGDLVRDEAQPRTA